MFGNPSNGGFLLPPDPVKTFKLKTAELRCLNRLVFDLYYDFVVILGMAKVRFLLHVITSLSFVGAEYGWCASLAGLCLS